MNMLTLSAIRADGEYRQLKDDLSRAFVGKTLPFAASGLCEGAANAAVLALLQDLRGKYRGAALFLLPEEKECVRMTVLATSAGLRAAFFEPRDLTFYDMTASHEAEHARVRVLYGIAENDFDVVFTTPDAALSYTLSGERLRAHSFLFDRDSTIDPTALAAALSAAGYVRVEMVEGAGQFAVRGGIIDIYPPYVHTFLPDRSSKSGQFPLRVELFGDEVDRIGIFDPETQRVHTAVIGCEFPPAREVLIDGAAR